MKLFGWARIGLIVFGSSIFATGLGPLVMAGIDDIVDAGVSLIVATNIVIVVLAVGSASAFFLLLHGGARSFKEWTSGVRLSRALIGSAVVACASLIVATADRENNTAWSYADKFETGAGVSKFRTREFGRYFARLRVNDPSQFDGSLGAIPVKWNLWAAGGQSTVLLRIPGTDATGRQSQCRDDKQVTLFAIAMDSVVAESAVSRADICGQWQRIDLDVSPGVTALRLGMKSTANEPSTELDVILVAHYANMHWIWNFCIVFALTILLSLLYVVSVTTRDQVSTGQSQRGKPAGQGLFVSGAILLFVVLGNAFVYSYVSQEKTIYTWDFAGYWTSTRNVSEFLTGAERKSASKRPAASQATGGTPLSGEPELSMPDPGAITALIRNFRFADYNVSSNLPVAPVLAVFGGSRVVYELSLLNIYALAAAIMLIVALRASSGAEAGRWPAWWPLVPVACVFCLVPFWVPILRGYMGISIVAPNLAVLWLYFRQPAEKIGTGTLVSIGALLLGGVILQRWNAYWVVAFCVLLAADSVRIYTASGSFGFGSLVRAFRAPIVAGFSAFFLFAVFAWPKVVTTITTDYADIYSAFLEDDGFLQAFVRLISAFGGGMIALIAAAFVYLVVDRATRRIALLLGLQLVVMFYHFSGTQTFGPHQILMLIPGLLIILSLALVRTLSSGTIGVRLAGTGASFLLLISGYASGMAVFAADGPPHLPPKAMGLLSQDYRPPLVRHDLDEFVRMARYIDAVSEKGEGLYVVAGSQTLNAAHFKNVGISTGIDFEAAERVMPSSVVDKRDGFPRDLLRAEIVVTSDPIQLSRRPSDHQVIRIPAESLMSGEGIGKAFERLPETFRLDGGVDVLIFRRIRPHTASEVADLSSKLRKFYPDRPDVYE